MSHTQMSHVTHMEESCHTHVRIITHSTHDVYKLFTAHTTSTQYVSSLQFRAVCVLWSSVIYINARVYMRLTTLELKKSPAKFELIFRRCALVHYLSHVLAGSLYVMCVCI